MLPTPAADNFLMTEDQGKHIIGVIRQAPSVLGVMLTGPQHLQRAQLGHQLSQVYLSLLSLSVVILQLSSDFLDFLIQMLLHSAAAHRKD